MAHPVFLQPFGEARTLAKVCISKPAERMHTGHVFSRTSIDEAKFTERRVEVTGKDAPQNHRRSVRCAKEEPGRSIANVLFQHAGSTVVKVNLSIGSNRLHARNNAATIGLTLNP